jgi:phospholipase/carboxylesterase
MTSGIHHITLITRKVQANVDYYAGFLGLRIVKRTGGFEDAGQLHLFYGDGSGSPGSLVTFLVWENGSPGRVGHGQVSEIAFAIAPESIGFWLTRALSFGLHAEGPLKQFGEPVLRLRDPDGISVKLIGANLLATAPWAGTNIPGEHTVRRVRGATILSEAPEQTTDFIRRHFGYRPLSESAAISRLISDAGDVVDVRDASGFWPGLPGTGSADHIAFRAQDAQQVATVEGELARLNSTVTTIHDRKYFTSLYVREPGGTLLELATDGPGFTVDEALETLGSQLFIPPSDADRADDIRVMLPQFAMPGEARVIYRELPFVHRFHSPDDPDGSTLVLLHGSGGNETDLMPFGRKLSPRATLLGVRGRSTEEGVRRWFRRSSATSFDQKDILFEAQAFAAFVEGANAAYGLEPTRTIFLGYSNGANLLAAFMLLHPHLARKAIFLRAVLVLENVSDVDRSDAEILMISGASDPYGHLAPALEMVLRASGAKVDTRTVGNDHELGAEDIKVATNWLARG